MKKELFILLRLGLNITSVNKEDISTILSMTEVQWDLIIEIGLNQGVIGIIADGIKEIKNQLKNIEDSTWFYKIIGGVIAREKRNESQIQSMLELATLWKEKNIQMMLLKGQANALNYPNSNHRDCGDIDCYLLGDYQKGNEQILRLGIDVHEEWTKHAVFLFNGEIVENHQYFINSLDKKWKNLLEERLLYLIENDTFERYPNSDILLPPIQFHAIFLTYHAMTHFLAGNLKLKQIVDWVMFVKKNIEKIDWIELIQTSKDFKMDVFLFVMNKVASVYWGIDIPSKYACCDTKLMNKFLHSILNDDDYIYDTVNKGRWHARIHYINYVIMNRWKYELAGSSAKRQLWLYVSTYSERNSN